MIAKLATLVVVLLVRGLEGKPQEVARFGNFHESVTLPLCEDAAAKLHRRTGYTAWCEVKP